MSRATIWTILTVLFLAIWIALAITVVVRGAPDDAIPQAAEQIDAVDMEELQSIQSQKAQIAAIEQHWIQYLSRKYKIEKEDKVDMKTGKIIRATKEDKPK